MSLSIDTTSARANNINVLQKADSPIHGWYRFVLSYPPHLVRQYVEKLGFRSKDILLDPFCGTGTTLVEAKKLGIPSIGSDTHPFAVLASRVKTNWSLNTRRVQTLYSSILRKASVKLTQHHLEALSMDPQLLQDQPIPEINGFAITEEEWELLPAGFLSARPLLRLLSLRKVIEDETASEASPIQDFFLLGLSHVIANGAGNFAFGPEIYRTKPKPDYDVLGHFARHVHLMMAELSDQQRHMAAETPVSIMHADARRLDGVPGRLAGVITSPPYPNEKDYTRTTRVESVLLRLITSRLNLREVKESLLRSNTRNVFVDDQDGAEVRDFGSIQAICSAIEARRLELNKTSGFERLYHKVVAHYFGGMRRHFRALRSKLKPRAKLAYVVGDQFSFLMVPIPTAQLLAEVANAEGFALLGCDLWRERIGTKVRNSRTHERVVRVREEVLMLEKR